MKRLVELPRFLAAGGTAALVNFASRIVFSQFMVFEIAVVIAYCAGMVTAFLLSKYFVFEASGKGVPREAAMFIAVNMVALVQTWLLSVYLAGVLSPRMGLATGEALAHLAGVMMPVVTSYFGHKYLTFKA